ncbi:RNA-binding S4 domain-containing protein [Candidatus Woesearchaeota archaeon]|nr:RNA-binding S4 domain-containing protein [Candidatus Woesearchaeota archaeon]
MKTDEQGKYIELADFLKFIGLAGTGGQAKILIRAGTIIVNGKTETKLRKKLRHGDTIEHKDKKYVVDEKVLK